MTGLDLKPVNSKRGRSVSSAPRIDMTPMVDLGFLLITFFIFTTTIAEKNAMALTMPKESTDSTNVPASKAFTVLLGQNNRIYTYEGKWQDAVRNKTVTGTNYGEAEGLGKLIREKQKSLRGSHDRDAVGELVLMIKPSGKASYKNLIDALDEALINNVKKYFVAQMSTDEQNFLANEN